MSKKISALTLAALLAVSMSAFAGETGSGKTCDKKDVAACKKKESCCKDADKCDKHEQEKCDKQAGKAKQ
jgi:hypothetical protein